MQKYEYLLVSHVNYTVKRVGGEEIAAGAGAFGGPKGPQIHEMANELGQDGWELIAAQYSHNPSGPGYFGDLWFKRPLP
jgi:hypothetical protein